LWFSFADLSRVIALVPVHRGHISIQFKSKVGLEITHQELRPDRARGVPTLGRMMFQFGQPGNGEGLENRVFSCILL
jgi:hypothetical protein